MTRYKIIANPKSGKGTAEAKIPLIEEELKKLGLDYDLVYTEHRWHAAELALDAVEKGFDVVVAAGGDGTVNEVLNGVMLAKDTGLGSARMAALSIGQGNDFHFGMGVPLDLAAGCETLAKGETRTIDVLRVTGGDFPQGRYVGNGMGIGFDAVVGFLAAKMKRLRGFAAYTAAAIQAIAYYYKAPLLEIKIDDRTITQPALMVNFMNGRRLGGGFMISPEGNPADGLIDVCITDQVSRPLILTKIPKFMAGTHIKDKAVHTSQARQAHVKALNGTLPVHGDGETICTHGEELLIELLPARLELIYNADHQPS